MYRSAESGYEISRMLLIAGFTLFTLSEVTAVYSKYPHYVNGHDTMVHLFEWKWSDIATECENFLGPRGFGGVQISPPNENLVIENRPWWERYQPVSYKLITRSGDESTFRDMVRRCNKAEVRVYVDAVFNHMSAPAPHGAQGTGGSPSFYKERSWPAVPYTSENFNSPHCDVTNHQDAKQVRNCQLLGAADLNQTLEDTRSKIVAYLNNLIDIGVAGFRIDSAKHMWPEDLENIYSRLNYLNVEHGFYENSAPFIYQEVIDYGGGAISAKEYTHLGMVTEYKHGSKLSSIFTGKSDIHWLNNWGEEWDLLPSSDAFVFIENQVTQHSDSILSYRNEQGYMTAIAFMLAHTYGTPRILSSYTFANADQGPLADSDGNLISPVFNSDNFCGSGFVCQHRWPRIYNMVAFRNAIAGEELINWWDNGANQIAFCRGHSGFIAFNLESFDLRENLQTCLHGGTYCDVISGGLINDECTGKTVIVSHDGNADIEISISGEDDVLAIHKGSRLR